MVESGTRRGFVNPVTCTEIHSMVARDDEDRANASLERIRNWVQVIEADAVWREASAFQGRYGVPLGDALTLATASVRDGTAFVGRTACRRPAGDLAGGCDGRSNRSYPTHSRIIRARNGRYA